ATSLTLADPSGSYGSEAAWCMFPSFHFGCGGAGPSSVFEQPHWQTGAGVPDSGKRMTSDIAMHAGGNDSNNAPKDLLFYMDGAWQTQFIGTGFVAAEIAGLFAIGVSWNGARLGQGNALL